jgi:hypothetical protein
MGITHAGQHLSVAYVIVCVMEIFINLTFSSQLAKSCFSHSLTWRLVWHVLESGIARFFSDLNALLGLFWLVVPI